MDITATAPVPADPGQDTGPLDTHRPAAGTAYASVGNNGALGRELCVNSVSNADDRYPGTEPDWCHRRGVDAGVTVCRSALVTADQYAVHSRDYFRYRDRGGSSRGRARGRLSRIDGGIPGTGADPGAICSRRRAANQHV